MTSSTPQPSPRERRIRTVLLAAIVGIVVTLAAMSGGPRQGRLPAGTPAPPFTLKDLDGGTHALEDLAGRRALIVFWATWCGVCRSELPAIADLAERRPDDAFLAIATQGLHDVARLKKRGGIPWAETLPIAIDEGGRAAAHYKIAAVPTTVILDRRGRIAATFEGAAGAQALARALDKVE